MGAVQQPQAVKQMPVNVQAVGVKQVPVIVQQPQQGQAVKVVNVQQPQAVVAAQVTEKKAVVVPGGTQTVSIQAKEIVAVKTSGTVKMAVPAPVNTPTPHTILCLYQVVARVVNQVK